MPYDPTAAVVHHGGFQSNPAAEADERLRKRVGWLNRNGGLTCELRYDQIAGALLHLPSQNAMGILKNLEENAVAIPDPTGYVLTMAAEAQPTTAALTDPNAPDEKLRRRVMWMNNHLTLPEPLVYERVAPDLLCLDPRQAMEVLKKLEENLPSISDLHGWVSSNARRAMQNTPAAFPSTPAIGAPPVAGGMAASATPEDRLKKRIGWLNGNVGLACQLDFDIAAASLLRLDITQAMAVLKSLEENAATVMDPHTFVSNAVESTIAARANTVSNVAQDSALDEALRKRIAWMNSNVPLQKPIMYDLIGPSLMALGDRTKAMEVLKSMESSALNVEEPSEHIVNLAAAYMQM